MLDIIDAIEYDLSTTVIFSPVVQLEHICTLLLADMTSGFELIGQSRILKIRQDVFGLWRAASGFPYYRRIVELADS